jgi:hypothetical protein
MAGAIAAALALGKLVSGKVFQLSPGDSSVPACAIALLASRGRRAAPLQWNRLAALRHE